MVFPLFGESDSSRVRFETANRPILMAFYAFGAGFNCPGGMRRQLPRKEGANGLYLMFVFIIIKGGIVRAGRRYKRI